MPAPLQAGAAGRGRPPTPTHHFPQSDFEFKVTKCHLPLLASAGLHQDILESRKGQVTQRVEARVVLGEGPEELGSRQWPGTQAGATVPALENPPRTWSLSPQPQESCPDTGKLKVRRWVTFLLEGHPSALAPSRRPQAHH